MQFKALSLHGSPQLLPEMSPPSVQAIISCGSKYWYHYPMVLTRFCSTYHSLMVLTKPLLNIAHTHGSHQALFSTPPPHGSHQLPLAPAALPLLGNDTPRRLSDKELLASRSSVTERLSWAAITSDFHWRGGRAFAFLYIYMYVHLFIY